MRGEVRKFGSVRDMSAPQRFLVGLVIGGVVAGVAQRAVGGADEPTVTTTTGVTTTSTTTPLEPAWIPDGGTRFGSTVLVPVDMTSADGLVRFSYELVPLGQVQELLIDAYPGALPDTWELRLTDGRVVEASTPPPRVAVFGAEPARDRRVAATVSFEADVLLDDVAAIVVTGWKVPVPVEVDFEVPAKVGQQAELFDGTVVTLDRLLEQRSTTIIGFSVTRPTDPWRTELDTPFLDSYVFRGLGAGWISSSSSIGGTGSGGSVGFQLTWGAAQSPDPVPIRFSTTPWVAIEAELVVVGGQGT